MANWVRTGWLIAALCYCTAGCGDNDNSTSNDNGGSTPTPTATATAPPQIPCPQLVTYQVVASGSNLDTGWTGVYAGIPAGDGGALTFAVDCPGDFLGRCGVCSLTGPVKSTTVIDNQRCANATNVICSTDADCPGSECSFFFGAPLAVSGGGLPICVTNRVAGPVTGTLVPELGSGDSNFPLELTFFSGIDVAQPCPTCSGDGLGTSGVCDGGPRDGQACTVDGVGVLGQTSFDCPPNPGADIGSTVAPLNLTTGTRSLAASESCSGGGPTDRACYCPGQVQPNACTDGVCTVVADGRGSCTAGPVDSECAIEFFRGCSRDADCPLPDDRCVERVRECLGPANAQTGATGPLTRVGTPSTSLPLQVGVFCLNETSSPAVNTTIGLPGPGAIRLPTGICIFAECPLGSE